MSDPIKYQLSEDDIPRTWYNFASDLPFVSPVLSPVTGEPVGLDDLRLSMPDGLAEQELSSEPEFEIPDEVRDLYRQWRPTPLFRARRLEREIGTPARIARYAALLLGALAMNVTAWARGMRASGTTSVSPKRELNRRATSRMSSRCSRWSSPTGTSSARYASTSAAISTG